MLVYTRSSLRTEAQPHGAVSDTQTTFYLSSSESDSSRCALQAKHTNGAGHKLKAKCTRLQDDVALELTAVNVRNECGRPPFARRQDFVQRCPCASKGTIATQPYRHEEVKRGRKGGWVDLKVAGQGHAPA